MRRLPPDIQELFKSYVIGRKKELNHELKLVRQGLDLCESPIEQMFLLGIIQHWWPTYPMDEEKKLGFHSKMENFVSLDYVSAVSVEIYPQREIEVGEKTFRVDFLLHATGKRFLPRRDNCWTIDERSLNVVVEIDGHDFHERNKAQAQRDKSRDRLLHKHGYQVIRYTGSEVFGDVYGVVRELAELILAKLYSTSNVYDLAYEL